MSPTYRSIEHARNVHALIANKTSSQSSDAAVFESWRRCQLGQKYR